MLTIKLIYSTKAHGWHTPGGIPHRRRGAQYIFRSEVDNRILIKDFCINGIYYIEHEKDSYGLAKN